MVTVTAKVISQWCKPEENKIVYYLRLSEYLQQGSVKYEMAFVRDLDDERLPQLKAGSDATVRGIGCHVKTEMHGGVIEIVLPELLEYAEVKPADLGEEGEHDGQAD